MGVEKEEAHVRRWAKPTPWDFRLRIMYCDREF